MNQSRSLTDLSVSELRKVLEIKEQIADLESQLHGLLGGSGKVQMEAAPKAATGRRGRPKMSPEARARIAAAQRARWAKQLGDSPAAAKPAAGKPGKQGRSEMSPEARARIAAAQRARWAKQRGDKAPASAPAVKSAVKSAGKRGGRRQLSPEARARIAAAQRARWAKQRG